MSRAEARAGRLDLVRGLAEGSGRLVDLWRCLCLQGLESASTSEWLDQYDGCDDVEFLLAIEDLQ